MAEEEKKERVYFVTMDEINRPVYMLGFKPLHLGMLFFALIIVAIISIASLPLTVGLLVISVSLLIIVKFGTTLARENNKGNPDYLDSIFLYSRLPKSVDDMNSVFTALIDEENERG